MLEASPKGTVPVLVLADGQGWIGDRGKHRRSCAGRWAGMILKAGWRATMRT